MNKFLFLLICFCLLSAKYANAQKDTVVAYMKNYHGAPGFQSAGAYIIDDRDSADFIRMITRPDKSIDKKLFQVYDLYLNGRQKMAGYSTTGNFDATFQGVCMEYFSTGKRKSFCNYEKGLPVGEMVSYFPNGGIYVTGNYNANGQLIISTSKDSTGKVLTENGTGTCITYADDFKTVIGSGALKNGLKDGKWQGALNDTLQYEAIYDNGKFISGFNISKSGVKTELVKEYTPPALAIKTADGSIRNFGYYISRNVRYPAVAREKGIFGVVQVEMYVTRSGQLMDIHAVKGDKILAEELLRVVVLSPPWQPGKYLGQIIDTKYSFSANFTMSGNYVSIEITP